MTCAALLAWCAPPSPPARVTLLEQGRDWTPVARGQFYVRSQGSDMIPLRWIRALKQPDGSPFMADDLGRYGYLHDPGMALPIGFTATGAPGREQFGMTCAACHTRQITMKGATYRADGGPALADFQTFLSDVDAEMGKVAADDGHSPAFAGFAQSVLGHPPTASEEAELRRQVSDWYSSYHTLMSGALPREPWGPGRLDAVGMIFDRLTGLDIGPASHPVIEANIQRADAPVRYPFLWNAARQDTTQWPGFFPNGDDSRALARNLGEVYGVFASFHPVPAPQSPFKIDYLHDNSADFAGLTELENSTKAIGPPRYPFAVDAALAARGAQVFGNGPGGRCSRCHGITPSASVPNAWGTPLANVGTDTREWRTLGWTADTGVLAGAVHPLTHQALEPHDRAFAVLAVSVAYSIAQEKAQIGGSRPSSAATAAHAPAQPKPGSYEARVLQGIWVAGPYLHNGSVPTLADLLLPSEQRPASFAVGTAYDPDRLGLAREQPGSTYVQRTTGCEDLASGNSRCGHSGPDYGTTLSDDDRRALLEYLKTL